MAKDRANIYTIAEEAGVSPSTVSRVMSNAARVSAEKRKRVEAAIRKYDYKPNALAQGLSTSRTKMIGIVVAHIENVFYSKMAAECERVANERGYMLMMLSSLSDFELEKRQIQKLYEQCVDAIIILGGNVDQVVADEEYVEIINRISEIIPVVATGRPQGVNCYKIGMDEGYAMELAMNYLVDLGHKEIAAMGGCKTVKSTLDKRIRYRSLIREHGLEYREEYLVETENYNFDSGYNSMKELLKKSLPSAVICINDFFACGVMKAIGEAGLKIPEDISIIGFDNTILSSILIPDLTGVACDYEDFSKKLVETAIGAAERREMPKEQITDVSLIIRSSCRMIK